ncbi:GSCFA domain-containing protein [Gilvibacter sediminis]|uniref:GSCFA domain-containing protein n=1 Tax=Gilvibacter sediminis TaxID=379071 RepID=UPI0023501DDF|nr:GSCFA domain-containing protein [Gilvibacter sediminis]MDC7997487.1 GSCFA domain-containing protein [Gilvibacter sediminis]
MKRSTTISFTPQSPAIDHHSSSLFLGSCFAINMAEKFDFFSLPYTSNPFGVLFQPLAIESLVKRALDQQVFTEADLDQRDDIWFSFNAHTSLSGVDKQTVLDGSNSALSDLRFALLDAKHIIITLGTAWAYKHLERNQFVANCHKQPGGVFNKELLSIQNIERSLSHIYELIHDQNPEVNVLFTVSPVRHIKDGIVENSRSKAHLLAAVHQVVDENEQAHYFPAYELLMDELRDYRYYGSDLIHPDAQAIFHVWECFKTAWVARESQELMETIGGLKAAMNHRSQIPGSNADRDFKRKLQERLEAFRAKHPHISI